MNYSIVTPGICKAQCSFCIQETIVRKSPTYLDKLSEYLDTLVDDIERGFIDRKYVEINITGGEPTEYDRLADMLNILHQRKDYFNKIVMTTNGHYLIDNWDIISSIIDHLNISRHHYDDKVRRAIFGIKTISDDELKKITKLINDKTCQTKDITLIATVTKDYYLYMAFYQKFIEYCASIGSKCAFRKDYNMENWQVWSVANHYADRFPVLRIGECPVCRQIVTDVDGVNVTWKFSHKTPHKVIFDYERVFQPNGVAYYDWDCLYPVDIIDGRTLANLVENTVSEPYKLKFDEKTGCYL